MDHAEELDIEFQVPFTHRLRFTDDVFGDDWNTVVRLLENSCKIARLQVWVDEGIALGDPNLLSKLQRKLERDRTLLELTSPVQIVPGGESIKHDERILQQVLETIDRDSLDRRSYLLAVGGGAFLDTIGLAAALAHRGIRLIRIPTTTLAQADSGVGVKTAINAFGKKNWKGVFAVPWGVINDRTVLSSLSDRDFRCGFSEAVKVALLKCESTFQILYRDAPLIANRDSLACSRAIRTSVLMHMRHITEGGDPFEAREARPLDFGHWSAHKLESLSNYTIRHGEAVAIGVALDAVYSSLRHGFPRDGAEQTIELLQRLHLPTYSPWLQDPRLLDGLEEFRQHLGGRLTVTMLAGFAKALDVHEVDLDAMQQSIEWLREREPSLTQLATQSNQAENSASVLPAMGSPPEHRHL